MKKLILILIAILLLGCSSVNARGGRSYNKVAEDIEKEAADNKTAEYKSEKTQIDSSMPDVNLFFPETSDKEEEVNSSLWKDTNRSFYADNKATMIGDIVFIVIDESLSASMTSNHDKTGYTDYTEKGEEKKEVKQRTNNKDEEINDEKLPESDSKNKTVSSSGDLTYNGRVAARVVNVDKYGNLFIEGSKTTMLNGEVITIKISGYVRTKDVKLDNTVSSENIADLEMTYASAMDIGEPKVNKLGTNKKEK